MRNSPHAQVPPSNLPNIPGVTSPPIKEDKFPKSKHEPEKLTNQITQDPNVEHKEDKGFLCSLYILKTILLIGSQVTILIINILYILLTYRRRRTVCDGNGRMLNEFSTYIDLTKPARATLCDKRTLIYYIYFTYK